MQAVEFLRRFHPTGYWVLTAIGVGMKKIATETFTPDQSAEADSWIEQWAGKANIYFSVNQPGRSLDKKATRADIASVPWLHVDIDARAGESLDAELERIRDLLENKCPVPPPSVIVFTGGGYQAFWRLEQPIAPDDIAAAYNKQLEIDLGGDSCFNIDRIMRLPGTMNIPNAKKVERGRVPAMAEVCRFDDELIYPLTAFQLAREFATAPDAPLEAQFIEDVNDLDRWGVADRIKVILVQGQHPDEIKQGDNSRSAWLFDAVCNLVRATVPDEIILGIITDPDMGISASVLDKGSGAKTYAQRQIARAHGEVGDDPVAWVNARFFAAMEGGKVAYYREEDDGSVEGMNSEAFTFELAPHLNDKKPYSAIWKASPRRRYYRRGFVLTPDAAPDGHYNLWRGFSVEPRSGCWDRMRDHVHEVLASGNAAHADYILRWTAWSVQHPHIPPRVAMVFRSDEEGVGKGAYCNALVSLFGSHGLRIQHMSHLTGKFNAHLRHCCMLFADEAVTTDSDGDGMLKGYITEPTIPIERKGVDVVQATNHLHVLVSSNSRWVLPVGATARRYAVFEVSPVHKGDRRYFEALFNGTNLSAMLHDLLTLDLGTWHPESARPDTAALNRQKAESLLPVEAAWFECLCSGEVPCGQPVGDWWKVWTLPMRDYVHDHYRRTDVSFNTVADLFKRLGYSQDTRARPRGYMVPPLAEAREGWDRTMFPGAWEKVGGWCGPNETEGGPIL